MISKTLHYTQQSKFSNTRGLISLVKGRYRNFCLLSALVVIIYALIGNPYMYFTPSFEDFNNSVRLNYSAEFSSHASCDIFDGRWVYDDSYPLYTTASCPFLERGFQCQSNGRPDTDYLKWRWQPHACQLPRFNASEFLKVFRDFHITFVGDSMARTQWESLVCLVMQGVKDKKTVYEVNGKNITKKTPYLGVRLRLYNLTIDYYRSPFLVEQSAPPKHVPKRVRSTMKLDKPDFNHKGLLNADVLVFNSGHWWTPTKTFKAGCYFQVGDNLKLGMKTRDAYQKALNTWASWVEKRVNTNRTHVFFRSYEPTHFKTSFPQQTCYVTQQPRSDVGNPEDNAFTHVLSDVMTHMTVPVTVLNVTTLSSYRSDAHIGTWSDKPSIADCSHWCLPGMPDTWNELLMHLLMKRINSKGTE